MATTDFDEKDAIQVFPNEAFGGEPQVVKSSDSDTVKQSLKVIAESIKVGSGVDWNVFDDRDWKGNNMHLTSSKNYSSAIEMGLPAESRVYSVHNK